MRRSLKEPGKLRLLIALAGLLMGGVGGKAWADGCYTCGAGSSPQCRDYCRYTGADTFDARKICEKKGCKIGSPSACPAGGGAVICLGPQKAGGVVTVTQPLWCAPATY